MTMIILLADDQLDVRSALRLLLEQEPGIRVAGEASTAEELLAAVKVAAPDLVLLDWELPAETKEQAKTLAALHALAPDTAVITLSGWPEARQAALAAGAAAFVSKNEPPETLLAAIHEVAAGMQAGRATLLAGTI